MREKHIRSVLKRVRVIIQAAPVLVFLVLGFSPYAVTLADDYPSQPIDLYIGSAPAGSTDVIGRVLARLMEERLGQPVVVHNTPGAGGAVMATQLMNAPPDGYTLGFTISHAFSGNPVVLPDSTDYSVRDFTHLASVSKGQCALVTNSRTPYTDFSDLIEAAKAGAAPVFASQSPLTRVVADFVASVAGVEFRIITVQGGGEMMQTILGGHADFGFSGGPHVDHVAAGQMRVLAAVEEARLATSPHVPTLMELGYDIASCALFVVSAPPLLPADVKEALSLALKDAIESSDMRELIRNLKYPEQYLGPEEVTQALEAETDALQRAIDRIGSVDDKIGANGELSSAFMPVVAFSLLLVAAATIVVTRVTGHRETVALTAESWRYLLLTAGLLSIAFVTMRHFGYLPGGFVAVAGFMLLARARLVTIALAAIALPIALWLLFEHLLGFPLP